MKSTATLHQPAGGTAAAPDYFDLSSDVALDPNADVRPRSRLFTYRTGSGIVAGTTTSIVFTIDRPARDIWPIFKDFNLWQKHHYYSGVVGDLEGRTYTLSDKPNDAQARYCRKVIRVVPEYLIVTMGVEPQDGSPAPGLPGLGGVNPGWSVFMLNERGKATLVTIFMDHGSYASVGQDVTAEEALAPWRSDQMAPEWQRKWREDFIPALKELVSRERHLDYSRPTGALDA